MSEERDSFNLVCDSEETPLHLSGGWVREPNLTAKKKNLVVFITSAISVKCHIKVKHLTCVLTHSSDLAPLCFLLSWQPVNMSFNDGVTQWAVEIQLDAIKVFSGTARFLVDPITSPAFVAVWNDWLRATAKLFCCCYTYGIAAGFCVTSQSRLFPLKGNVEKRGLFLYENLLYRTIFLTVIKHTNLKYMWLKKKSPILYIILNDNIPLSAVTLPWTIKSFYIPFYCFVFRVNPYSDLESCIQIIVLLLWMSS